jgi:hypothetical protein
LLLEPAATNLAILSTDYSGAGWAKSGVTLLEDRNQPDPFGGNNASIIRIDSIGGSIQRATTGSSGAQYSGAFWIKRIAGTGDCNLRVVENANIVVPVTNQWQRFTATQTSTTTVLRIGVGGATIGDEFAIYQAQLETGPVSTSDIITSGSTVTRLADDASKTGISSLIGQTEGTLFVEFDFQPTTASQSVAISDGTSSNRLDIRLTTGNVPAFVVVVGGVIQISISSAVTMTQGQRVKLAAAYKSNDFVLYQNGALVASATSGTIGGTLSRYGFDLNGGQKFNNPVNQALVFKTRLTNAQLAELTTL